jgi:hypothetical protein
VLTCGRVLGAVKRVKDASTNAAHQEGLGVILNKVSAYSHMDSSCNIHSRVQRRMAA